MNEETIRLFLVGGITFLSSIGLFSSISVLGSIFYFRKRFPMKSSARLISNSYAAILLTCFALLDGSINRILFYFNPNLNLNHFWCFVRSFLLHCGLCSIYHSFVLQTFYRFSRIVFHRCKSLQTERFVRRSICFQWICSFSLILIVFLVGHVDFLVESNDCQIPFGDFRGLIVCTSIVYYFPMMLIISMYFYIISFLEKSKNSLRIDQRKSNQRDVAVVRRIIVLILILLLFCLPAIILWIFSVVRQVFSPIFYDLQSLTFSLSSTILAFASTWISAHVRNIFRFKRRAKIFVHPQNPIDH